MLCWVQEEWIVEAVDQKTKKIEVRKTEGLLQVQTSVCYSSENFYCIVFS